MLNENADLTRKQPEKSRLIRLLGRMESYARLADKMRNVIIFGVVETRNAAGKQAIRINRACAGTRFLKIRGFLPGTKYKSFQFLLQFNR